jgi:DNA repair protein RecO (recombination protein O)
MPIASDALVLRTYKMGETSKVVVLLTRERGKLRAVAKGARGSRNRYQSALEPLSEVHASLYGRQGSELLRLGACELLRSAFPLGTQSLESALALSYFAELLDAFAQEGEVEDAVYRLAKSVIGAAREGMPGMLLARYLEAWLLKLHGVYPPMDRCAGCGAVLPLGELHFHAPAHGFVCGDCGLATGPTLPASERRVLEEMFRRPPAAFAGFQEPLSGLESFHQSLVSRHLERDLRSYRVLKDIARSPGA